MNTITVHGKTYKLPKKPVWRSGPPPSAGWWPASASADLLILRWWDGEGWSDLCTPNRGVKEAEFRGGQPSFQNQEAIKWAYRWWENQK